MEYVFNALWVLMDLVFFYFCWEAFLPSSKSPRRKDITIAIAWVIGSVYTCFISTQIPKMFLSLLLFFLVSSYLYKGAWYQRIVCIILGYTISGIVDVLSVYGVSFLLGISYSEFVWRKIFYVVTVSLGKLISILLAWIFWKIRNPYPDHAIQKKWLLLTLLFPAVSLVMLAVIFDSFQSRQDLSLGALVFSIFLAVANIAIIYLNGIMERSTRQIQENMLLQQRMEIQTEEIESLEKNYRMQRKIIHEHNNQIQTIHDLLAADEYDAALSYVQQLQQTQTTRIFAVNSHHPIIDAVLNHKYQLAQEKDIDIHITVNDLSGVSLSTYSLVVILSNLLDNAVEACVKLPQDRMIQCCILETDSLYISIRNTSAPVDIQNNSIPTTKEPREDHGYGLTHIDYILSQLHAEYVLSYNDGWFEFATEIPHEIP